MSIIPHVELGKGNLLAVDVGKSVSRVGGKTQLRAYRAAAGDLRLSYSQFEEIEVYLANVSLARAKATEDLARERVKAAEENLDKNCLNLKTAKAEYKAAEANRDAERMSNVEKTSEKVKEAIKTAQLLVKWREKEVSARKTGVKKAKLGVELSENKRSLARISRLVTEKISSANNYSLADYKNKHKKIQEDYQKTIDKEKREMLEAEKLKAQYEKRAREV